MSSFAQHIIGPRASAELAKTHPLRYRLPALLLIVASVLLLISLFRPYWKITMFAPQYPNGLTVTSYINRVGGRVGEVDILNQYIGMKPLEDAAKFEKRLSVPMLVAMALLLVAAVKIHSPYAAWLSLPAILFPLGFLADLQFWLADFGLHLDPHAPLNMSVKPFVPQILGVGHVGQFKSEALPCSGLILATIASIVIITGLWLQRRAYKPLRDGKKATPQGGQE
ncbi:MAG: cytochrome C [Verrucomicrobiota bacterium]|nr:cytochrome C [Verrucomicrobiota bacterium]